MSTDVARAMTDAVASRSVVRGIGSGTWLFGGPVVNDDAMATVRPPSGVIEYTPGDLVITVHAGTTLHELSAVCAPSAATSFPWRTATAISMSPWLCATTNRLTTLAGPYRQKHAIAARRILWSSQETITFSGELALLARRMR